MYTNANFWRDMAIIFGSLAVAIASLMQMQDDSNPYGYCDPRYC